MLASDSETIDCPICHAKTDHIKWLEPVHPPRVLFTGLKRQDATKSIDIGDTVKDFLGDFWDRTTTLALFLGGILPTSWEASWDRTVPRPPPVPRRWTVPRPPPPHW